MEIQFTSHIFKEGVHYVAHTPELDVSSCGETEQIALGALKEAVRLFLEQAASMGTLTAILEQAGYNIRHQKSGHANVHECAAR